MSRILVAYFTHSGKTRQAAERTAQISGGTLFEIKTAIPYPTDYNAVIQKAKEESAVKARPELEDSLSSISDYDTIVIAFPNWCSTCPMAVLSFLEAYDLSGKKIMPLITHGGGGIGRTDTDIAESCPNSQLVPCLDGNSLTDDKIKQWFHDNGVEV